MTEYAPDQIFAPDEVVKTIADGGNTPFFLYHKQGILDGIHGLHAAFDWNEEYQNYFPLRENCNPQILKLLCEAGTGVSACNYAELCLARACGFANGQLLYEPTRKDRKAESLALELGACWLVNSQALLPDQLPERVILRYHPMEERLSAVQFPKIGRSKNGFNRRQILDVLAALNDKGVKRLGLMVQVASYNIQPGFWDRKAAILLSLVQEIKEKLDLTIWCLHIGEGPGLPYHPRVTAPDQVSEAEKVKDRLKTAGDYSLAIFTGVTKPLLEPHGLLVTKILEQRDLYKTFLVLDAGMCQYIGPVLKQAYRHVSVLGKTQTTDRKLYSLVGELPNEIDRMVHHGRMLPKVRPGEYCVVHDVGCSARSMPLLYGFHPLPAEYLYEQDGSIHQIAGRRTEQEVMEFLTAL